MLTVSEKLFEDYCILRGYSFNRTEIVAGEGRFSDYEFQTPRGTVICKVKEILPNADNKAFDERLVKYRYADSSRAIGKRAPVPRWQQRPVNFAVSGTIPAHALPCYLIQRITTISALRTLTQPCSAILSPFFRPIPQVISQISHTAATED